MTRVKMCGLTNLDDALCAVDAGADLLGFILYAPSPRHTTVPGARAIVAEVKRRAPGVVCVGVFVNETAEAMLAALREASLDAAQLSGDEPPEALRALGGRGYKAVRRWQAEDGEAYAAPGTPPALPDVLLDAPHTALYGGTGQRADEGLAAAIARERRLLLAGGLRPDNVAEAVRAVRPWGVDVASGVERQPGFKDHAKVRAFIAAAKRALSS